MNTSVIHLVDEELVKRINESADEGRPLRVEADGKTFVLVVKREEVESSEPARTGYDPDKVAEVLDKYVGAWSHLDVDRMIEDLYKAREEGSRPADRP